MIFSALSLASFSRHYIWDKKYSECSVERRRGEKRDACVAGKLSFEDFVAWLDSDKQR